LDKYTDKMTSGKVKNKIKMFDVEDVRWETLSDIIWWTINTWWPKIVWYLGKIMVDFAYDFLCWSQITNYLLLP
jgi:hypothetical protein